jgi:porin
MKKLFFLLFIVFAHSMKAQDNNKIQDKFDNGIHPFLSYVSIAVANVSGGINPAEKYAGQVYTGLNLDLEKILGWKGTRGKISVINRHGQGLENEVGSVFEPLNMVG